MAHLHFWKDAVAVKSDDLSVDLNVCLCLTFSTRVGTSCTESNMELAELRNLVVLNHHGLQN